MGYIITLFILISIVFSTVAGLGPLDDMLNKAKSAILNVAIPKSETEITIDNLKKEYDILDDFFSETGTQLTKSKQLTEKQKKDIKIAEESLQKSIKLVGQLQKLEEKDKKVIKSLIEKTFDLNDKKDGEPTYTSIPPQCQMICASPND